MDSEVNSKKRMNATISMDLDNLWSYLKVRGDERWKEFPSYLNRFLPYFLDLLDRLQLKITFFIVGQDAAISENKALLQEIAERGHEIGSHSYSHDPYLHLCSRNQLETEISQAEQAIYEAVQIKPKGYRGPGFSWNADLIRILHERGYLYDSTIFPTFIGPVLRKYYQKHGAMNETSRKQSKSLFGSFRQGFLSLKPYFWEIDTTNRLLEFPISTIPILKIPFHLSYLIYLASYSRSLMKWYFNFAIKACSAANVHPNFLIHPTDLLGEDIVPELHFFPGMSLRTKDKEEIFHYVVNQFSHSFRIQRLSDQADEILFEGRKLNRFPLYQ